MWFSGTSPSGQTLETQQIVYVTSDSDKLFLSRETCTAMGMFSEQFPSVGETLQAHTEMGQDMATDAASQFPQAATSPIPESAHSTSCTCPRRQKPPPRPTQLPFPATEANRPHLQQWLLDYYSTGTFNTCEYQPLPLMEGVPMRLMVNPTAEPVAHHSPVPVPLHWQADVKKGLDQDMMLGVLEPVPVGEPVTWCHRMVVCAKKNCQPRRTVDFQVLNLHVTRETHHTHISSSMLYTQSQKEDCLWLLERLPQRTPRPRRLPPHHIHHRVGVMSI